MKTIMTFGDSITACARSREMDRWPAILDLNLEKSHPGKFQVINRGIGGNTTYDGLNRLNIIVDSKPSYVFVQFGFNDAVINKYCSKSKVSAEEYGKNLEQFCDAFKRIKAKTILIVNHPTVPNKIQKNYSGKKSYQETMKTYDRQVKRVAKKFKCPVIDLPAEIKKRKIKPKDFVSAHDGLHLSAKGSQEYGKIVYESFLKLI